VANEFVQFGVDGGVVVLVTSGQGHMVHKFIELRVDCSVIILVTSSQGHMAYKFIELRVDCGVIVLLRLFMSCREQSRELSLEISSTLSLASPGLLETGLDLLLEVLHGQSVLSCTFRCLLAVLVVLSDQRLNLL
jgi:hypothetical protein